MTQPKKAVLAVDIGGSKLMTGLIAPNGELFYKRRYLWSNLQEKTVLREVGAAAAEALGQAAALGLLVTAAGVTIPGLTDPAAGVWVEASFSGIRGVPLAAILSERLEIPVYLENDAKASALAEQQFGGGRGVRNFLYLTISNGVGGAYVADGALQYGATGSAGEVGHTVVVPGGRRCNCGLHGCLEMYAAGPGLVQTYQELGGTATPANGESIAQKAADGEAAALETFELQGHYLGQVIGGACNLLNPEKVILGGGLSLAFEWYEKPLLKHLHKNMYHAANPNVTVEPTVLRYDGGLYGAAATALRATV